MLIRELHDRFGISFLHLWGICLILVSLLYARFELLLMHSNPLCNYLMMQPIMLQGWLLYTYSIQFSVQLIIQSLLWVILHVQLIIVVSKINLSLGSISTIMSSNINELVSNNHVLYPIIWTWKWQVEFKHLFFCKWSMLPRSKKCSQNDEYQRIDFSWLMKSYTCS